MDVICAYAKPAQMKRYNIINEIPPSINVEGKLIVFDRPKVMGILNATPDSFHSVSRVAGVDEALALAEKMVAEGAEFLDLGGCSTRPGSEPPTIETEWERIHAIIPALRKAFPDTVISVDTYRSEIARRALDAGAQMINDISGGTLDPQIFKIVAEYQVPYVLSHLKGVPKTMQDDPQYQDLIGEIYHYFSERIKKVRDTGINDIILDPGFGFGKKLEHNFLILKNLHIFQDFAMPVMVGISRKSMIHKALGISPDDALNGTTALHMAALMGGAHLLRVHDVKEAVQTIKLYELIKYTEA
ncbi:dihydropteroate synthase [Thermaurantimonas aggregans]|uniref:dihydropteroate synthase n=2 Tax=Thermaurantimonas aggregans TaxID=2173829 RepID=A0A401XLW4_9FLAO|nr:dihydropteroate synthase [Thermaurantimonas aggregans]